MEGDCHPTPSGRDHAIGSASCDPVSSGHEACLTDHPRFYSAGMLHRQGIAERDREYELAMAARSRLASVVVTDPGAGLSPGFLERGKVAVKMMAAMGHKVGMGLGKDADGIRIPPECPWRPLRAGLGSIQEPRASYATDDMPYP